MFCLMPLPDILRSSPQQLAEELRGISFAWITSVLAPCCRAAGEAMEKHRVAAYRSVATNQAAFRSPFGAKADFICWPRVLRFVDPKRTFPGLLLIVPEHTSIAANVNDNCVFPLFSARFGCHHLRERMGGLPCAGVSRSGWCLLREQ